MCVSSDLLRSLGVTVSLPSHIFFLFQELASLEPQELERNAFNDSLVSLGFVDFGEYYNSSTSKYPSDFDMNGFVL